MDDAKPDIIEVSLNGEPTPLAGGTSVADLIQRLGLRPEHLAVELNERIVRRAQHGTTVLADRDTLEIVTLVGGG